MDAHMHTHHTRMHLLVLHPFLVVMSEKILQIIKKSRTIIIAYKRLH